MVPDCGFWETLRCIARGKLHAMVGGARLVRHELYGTGACTGKGDSRTHYAKSGSIPWCNGACILTHRPPTATGRLSLTPAS